MMTARTSAEYSSGYASAQDQARGWPSNRIRTLLGKVWEAMSVCAACGDRRGADRAAGIVDGLTDLLLSPSVVAAKTDEAGR